MGEDNTRFSEIAGSEALDALDLQLGGALAEAVEVLRASARDLDAREKRLAERERAVETFLTELRLLRADLLQGDTSSRYRMPEISREFGIDWVDPDTLPARERQVLRVLQLTAERELEEQGQLPARKQPVLAVKGSNTELIERLGEHLPGVNTSAFSACLTRMRHRKVVALDTDEDGERLVILRARIRRP